MMSVRFSYSALLFAVLMSLMAIVFSLTPALAHDGDSHTHLLRRRETVVLSSENSAQKIEILAKVDTGATYSSIDTKIAKDLGIDLKHAKRIKIESSLGRELRPLVAVRLQVAGGTLDTLVTVNSRKYREEKMLVGRRDVQGFLIDVTREQLTEPGAPSVRSPIQALLDFPPPPPSAPTLLATLPLAGLVIVLLRTVVGLETFGLFAPVLLAVTFVQTGLPVGVGLFCVLLLAGLGVRWALRPLHLPRAARLAVLLAVAAEALLAANTLVDSPQVGSTWATAFPLVVMAGIIERFWNAQE